MLKYAFLWFQRFQINEDGENIIMKIMIIGGGKIGSTVISDLVSEGHDVTVVDSDGAVLSDIVNIYDVMGVCGNGVDRDVLLEAGVAETDLVISSTSSDELNMLSAFLAKRLGAKHTIARIRNPEYNGKDVSFLRQQLELSLSVNPEQMTAREIFNLLKFPSAVKIETFARRNLELMEMYLKEGSSLNGLSLAELRSRFNIDILVCCVLRGDEVVIPDGSFVLKSGDKIGLTGSPKSLQDFLRAAAEFKKQAKDVMILGGSRIAVYLAEKLIGIGCTVKIIEKDEETCLALSEQLPKASIIHGDGTQQEVLLEEGLRSVDAFVALTGTDEENILVSIFAASHNVPKIVSKVNRNELISMANRLGVECVVSPKKIVSDIILQHARALENSIGNNVETLYRIMDDKAEALEFNVVDGSDLVNIPLKDLKLKQNILIGGIYRDGKMILPKGSDVILPNDRVFVIAANQRLADLSDILVK